LIRQGCVQQRGAAQKVNTSDDEVAQLVKFETNWFHRCACVTLITDAHQHEHPFASAIPPSICPRSYAESVILEIAKTDQLDIISGDA